MWDFNRIRLVAIREIASRFKMKAYRATLVIQILIALLAGLTPVAMAYFSGESSSDVIVVDTVDSGLADRLSPLLDQNVPGVTPMSVSSGTDAEAARKAVEDGDASVAVVVTGSGDAPRYELITRDGATNQLNAQLVQGALVTANVVNNAVSAGVSEENAQALVAPAPVTVQDPEGETHNPADNFSGPKFAIVNISIIITYMAIMMYGLWVAQGVVEEKASRIMEIMVNAATPRDLLFGKVIGVLIAGLVQLLPMMLAAGISFALQPRIADALNVTLPASFDFNFASLSFKVVGIILVYFILGYLLYAALYAATASLVSRQEEVSQATGPVMVLVVVGLFLAYAVMALPNSLLAKWLFIIPLTSPFVAMSRILMGDPSGLEIAASIGFLVLAGLLAMWAAAGIYRTGVLMYGQKVGLMHLIRNRGLQKVAR